MNLNHLRTDFDDVRLWIHQKDHRGITIWSVYANQDDTEKYLWVMHGELVAQKELPAWLTMA